MNWETMGLASPNPFLWRNGPSAFRPVVNPDDESTREGRNRIQSRERYRMKAAATRVNPESDIATTKQHREAMDRRAAIKGRHNSLARDL